MSDACTITGLTEFAAAVTRLPDAVTLALKRVAEGTANRVEMAARRRLLEPRPPFKVAGRGYGDVAAAMEITEDLPNKQYVISSVAPSGTPGNLVLWIEFGTVHMPARPYMAPSLHEENASYIKDVEAAAVGVVRDAVEG